MRARVVAFWLVCAAVLLPALGLTLARLVDPPGKSGVAAVALTPLALPLYAVAAVLVVVRLAVVRRWRGPGLPVVALAVAGLALHAWWYAPQVAGANPPPAAGATPLVVMTSNLRLGEGDGVDVVRTASARDVDLLVVEEITPALLARMEQAGLADLFPYRAGQAQSGASGTMAFARTPLTDAERVPTALSTWAFTMGDLRVLAVHPAYPLDDAWEHDQEVLADAARAHDADLLVGDFNATLDHAPMRALVGHGYRDVGELANDGWNPTWPAHGSRDWYGVVPVAQIDHVLVGPRLAALGMSTVDVPGTDHRALVARVAPR